MADGSNIFPCGLPWPKIADSADIDGEPLDAPRLPHEFDELLGEFVDVLYNSADSALPKVMSPPSAHTSVDLAISDGTSSLPPSSPASQSAESGTGLGWASEEGIRQQNSGSSSPLQLQPGPPPAVFKRDLDRRAPSQRGLPTPLLPSRDVSSPMDAADLNPTTCWGALTKGHTRGCEAGFVIGKAHFKNKFCARCRERIDMPLHSIRALTPGLREAYTNPLSEGFWKRAPPTLGGGAFRLVNNTQSCIGPCLIIYQNGVLPDLPPSLSFAPLPQGWAHGEVVPLCVAKGTLVPVLQMWKSQEDEARNRPKRRRQEKEERPAWGTSAAAGGNASAPDRDSALEDASGGFVAQLVGMHEQLALLLDARLAEAKVAGGSTIDAHQKSVMLEQLAYSKAFLQTAATDKLAAWRSLGGLPPLIPAAYPSSLRPHRFGAGKQTAQHSAFIDRGTPAADTREEEEYEVAQNSRILLTSCSAQAPNLGSASHPDGLLRASDEALAASSALRSSQEFECTHADGIPASKLEGLMAGQSVWFFCGHADAAFSGQRTLAFAHPRGFELVDADTLVSMIGRHAQALQLIVLNGCKSLHLALRLADVGVPFIACWESIVNDEAAFWFGLGFSRALASGKPPRGAFAAAVGSLLVVTEPAVADCGEQAWMQKFELADPEACGADLRTGRPSTDRRGRIAAGLPWLICPLASEMLRGVPAVAPSYLPRKPLEKHLLTALVYASAQTCYRPNDTQPSSSTHPTTAGLALPSLVSAPVAFHTPRAVGAKCVALVGSVGRGKRLLATWAVRDYRVQSLFRDGIVWLSIRQGAVAQLASWLGLTAPLSSSATNATGLLKAALGRRRCLLVLDGVDGFRGDAMTIFEACGAEQTLLITTRSSTVASAMSMNGASCICVAPLHAHASCELLGSLLCPSRTTQQLRADDGATALLEACVGEPLLLRLGAGLVSITQQPTAESYCEQALGFAPAARLLSSSALSEWPSIRGLPSYPYPSVHTAFVAIAESLTSKSRMCWEQLAIVTTSPHAVHGLIGCQGGAVSLAHLQGWWRSGLLPALSELLDVGIVVAVRCSGDLNVNGANEQESAMSMLSVPPLAARFVLSDEYTGASYPTARSRARCVAEFVASRSTCRRRGVAGMLRSILSRRGTAGDRTSRTAVAAPTKGDAATDGGPKEKTARGVGAQLKYAPAPTPANEMLRPRAVSKANGGTEGTSLAAAAAAAAAASATSLVAPFAVSAGWRSLGSALTHEGTKEGDDQTDSTISTRSEDRVNLCDDEEEMTDETDTEGEEQPSRREVLHRT